MMAGLQSLIDSQPIHHGRRSNRAVSRAGAVATSFITATTMLDIRSSRQTIHDHLLAPTTLALDSRPETALVHTHCHYELDNLYQLGE